MAAPTPFEAFIQPARALPQIWRVLLGCVLIAVCWGLPVVASGFAMAKFGMQLPNASVTTLYVIYLFLGMAVGAGLAARLLHQRSAASLFSPSGFRAGRFAFTALALSALSVIGTLAFAPAGEITRNLPVFTWLCLLPFGFVAILIQTSAEEMVFRGYLMQALAARFRSRIVWMGVPSLIFGLLHWDPAIHGKNAWLVALAAGVVGLILSDVTARCGDLSPAIGLHFANNVIALLVLAPPSPLDGLSLLRLDLDMSDTERLRLLHLSDMASILLIYALWFLLWGRRLRLHSAGAGPISAANPDGGPSGA